MGFEPEELRARRQVFADRAEQAELRARECADQSVRDSWVTIAKSWWLLAERPAQEFPLKHGRCRQTGLNSKVR